MNKRLSFVERSCEKARDCLRDTGEWDLSHVTKGSEPPVWVKPTFGNQWAQRKLIKYIHNFYIILLDRLLMKFDLIRDSDLRKENFLLHWFITQKVFLGSGTEEILYMPSERALKMLSFDSNFIRIGSRWGVREQI